jgi:NADPH-dependent 2,4-dienoyl-CoA reductase/sulfur reductase-like enzyme/two-component sensor histidine kinase/rhodanese-related sulfurtransferase
MTAFNDISRESIRILSHQLKTPVSTIHSLLKAIADGFTGETNTHTLQFIDKAISKASEANRLIADLLQYEAYSRPEIMEKTGCDITALADAAVAAFMPDASKKGLSLRVRLPENSAVIVHGSARGLEIALNNLIENAIKYSRPGGSVSVKITVNKTKKKCVVHVADSGSGIPENERNAVFAPFFRSVKNRSVMPGTGLGLAITKSIITAHNGTIAVTSSESAGSTFTITLPYKMLRQKKDGAAGRKKVLIIGGVTAGPKAAARLRRLDERLDITIIERSEFLSYSGCGLPSYISGRVFSPRALMSTADNTIRDISFFETIKNIRILNRTEALRIDRKKKSVIVKDLASGETRKLLYDALVLATGAASAIPPIRGIGQKGIYSLHSIEDAEAIKNVCAARSARDVIIIGGGLIGIETAESLMATGARVTIFEKKPHVLSSLFDPDFSGKIENALNGKGVKVITDAAIRNIARKEGRLVFFTGKGKFFADLAILSAGVKPNSALARKSGLVLGSNGAIKVNRYLQTSDKAIYAAGDCAESVNFLTNRYAYWPLGSISTKMGRIAADNICGRRSAFRGFIGTTMFKAFDLTVARTGLTITQCRENGFRAESMIITGLDKAHYSKNAEHIAVKLIADAGTGVLLGAQAYGRGDVVRHVQLVATAIAKRMTLTELFDGDLGYAPMFNNPIDIVQTACCMLAAKIEGFIATITPDKLTTNTHTHRIVDVSPFAEHLQDTLPDSINVPLEDLRREGIPVDKNERCVLYSKTSSRAYQAYRYLVAQGYSKLAVLEGGYLFWSN